MECRRVDNTIYLSALNHPKIVDQFIYSVKEGIERGYEDFVIDLKNVNNIYPNVTAPIAGIMDFYKSEGKDFILENMNQLLENIGIHQPYLVKENKDLISFSILNRVWKFENYEEVFLLVNSFLDELQKTDQFENGVLNGLEWSLNEVMDNVIQHSNADAGYVMGQIHKTSKHVAFCIFDYGQGIYNSLKSSKNHNPKHPVDALTLCIKEGITRDKNIGQGNGLYGLHQIIKNNKGQLAITSNSASFYMKGNNVQTLKNLPTISRSVGCATIDFQVEYDKKVSLEEALKFGGEKYTFVNFRVEDMENDSGEIEYSIHEKSQGYGTRKAGIRVRNEVLNIYKEVKKPINLDFKGVSLISSSYADEVIGKLVLEFGFFGFNNVIRLKNMNKIVQSILQRSVSQRMAESLKENKES